MTNTVLIKRSGTANAVPSAGNLVAGELAINYTDGNLFYKNSSNVVTVIASNQFVSVSGNVTGGNVLTGGQVSATGNVTGNYFIGNGSQLTGITTSGGTSIDNGTSNVAIPTASGNISVSVAGNANTAVFGVGVLTSYGAFATPKTINDNVAVPELVNSWFMGPVVIANSASITVPSTATLYVLSP
jgi:hypothetical protein